jgi:hypothetical protein
MKNPWTKRNPFMSMWLSAANSVLGRARGPVEAQAAQQRAVMTKQATRFWTGAWLVDVKPRRRR